MKKVDSDFANELLKAVAAADRIRADIKFISQLADRISNDQQLADACGFNEGTSQDSDLVSLIDKPEIRHLVDAPVHWVMRSGAEK